MDELENNKTIFKKSPFLTIPIMRGQQRGLSSNFLDKLLGKIGADESGELSNLKEVG